MTTDGGDFHRQGHPQPPTGQIHLVNALIAQVAIAGVPNPMPVVVKTIFRERFQRGWPGPQIVMDSGGNRLWQSMPDCVPPLVTETARKVNVANRAALHFFHRFANGCTRTALATM